MITGLSIGLTLGIIFTPILIGWGTSLGMGGDAWRMPFFAFAVFTLVVVAVAFMFFRAEAGRGDAARCRRSCGCSPFSAPTFVVIVALFLLAETLRWPEWLTALVAGVIAAGLHRGHRARRAAVRPRRRPCSTATSG